MRRYQVTFFLLFVMIIAACGGGSDGFQEPMGTLSVNIKDATYNDSIRGASIVVYDSSNRVVADGLTDNTGEIKFSLSPGTYSISAAAQDYMPVPPPLQQAVPFEILNGETTSQNVALDVHPDKGNTAQISGRVLTPAPDRNGVPGVLVVAKDADQNLAESGISGIAGDYLLCNVKPGDYKLQVYRGGYREASDSVTIVVESGGIYGGYDIEITEYANADLSGQVSFLAVTNGVVDITLIHPDTLDTIPGLSTQNDANNNYRLGAVPPGTFIAWASFENDGYVIDPDRVAKFGLPQVTFTVNSTDQTQDFEVTDAVIVTSPSNSWDLAVPVEVNTETPTFTWEKYPSAKEYIIEVFNSKGESIWGGFDTNGVTRHPQVLQHETSAVFNFDGSASEALQDGQTYRWKIYVDSDEAPNIQGLITSSEDQMGLFRYIDSSL